MEDLSKEIIPFQLTRGAIKAVELLNENMYFKLFTDGTVPADDVILPYRILFSLVNYAELLNIKDNEDFWRKTSQYFVEKSEGKMGNLMQNLVKTFDFSDENIYRVGKLVGGHSTKMSPNHYSKLCATTGLVIFLVKDALDYSGILLDKKTSPVRIYKNLMFNFEMLQGKIERVKKLQKDFFS
jgi:hypothetical protein